MIEWEREAAPLKDQLGTFDLDDFSTIDHQLASQWVSQVKQFHKKWGHKMVPELAEPLKQIEVTLGLPQSGIEAGCWSYFEETEDLMWYGSMEWN